MTASFSGEVGQGGVRIRKETWGGRQRRKCKDFYSTQVCKELQNLILESKTHSPINRSWRREDGCDEHTGSSLPGAGVSGSVGGGGRDTTDWLSQAASLLWQPDSSTGMVLAALLDVLTVSSVPAGPSTHSAHFSLPCFNVT